MTYNQGVGLLQHVKKERIINMTYNQGVGLLQQVRKVRITNHDLQPRSGFITASYEKNHKLWPTTKEWVYYSKLRKKSQTITYNQGVGLLQQVTNKIIINCNLQSKCVFITASYKENHKLWATIKEWVHYSKLRKKS